MSDHTQNIFKAFKDLEFKDTVSHECGVTLNDSVEARAIAELMSTKPGLTVTYMPAMIRIDGEGKIISTSTHYGRMVMIDENTMILFGDMNEAMSYVAYA